MFFFFLIEWQIVYLFVYSRLWKSLFRPTHHSRSHYPLIELPVTLIKYVAQISCCSSRLSPLFFWRDLFGFFFFFYLFSFVLMHRCCVFHLVLLISADVHGVARSGAQTQSWRGAHWSIRENRFIIWQRVCSHWRFRRSYSGKRQLDLTEEKENPAHV